MCASLLLLKASCVGTGAKIVIASIAFGFRIRGSLYLSELTSPDHSLSFFGGLRSLVAFKLKASLGSRQLEAGFHRGRVRRINCKCPLETHVSLAEMSHVDLFRVRWTRC